MSYDYFFPEYITAAEQEKRASKTLESLKKKGLDVHPVLPFKGRIASSFWGKSWCTCMESYADYENRLGYGKSDLRYGAVCHLAIDRGHIHALVSDTDIYTVDINIKELDTKRIQELEQLARGKISSRLDLLLGNIPEKISKIIGSPYTGIIPFPREISYKCTCPDSASMCKHIAAVLYAVGRRLDEEPTLLFSLRGLDPDILCTMAADVDLKANDSVEMVAADTSLGDLPGIDPGDMDADASAQANAVAASPETDAPKGDNGPDDAGTMETDKLQAGTMEADKPEDSKKDSGKIKENKASEIVNEATSEATNEATPPWTKVSEKQIAATSLRIAIDQDMPLTPDIPAPLLGRVSEDLGFGGAARFRDFINDPNCPFGKRLSLLPADEIAAFERSSHLATARSLSDLMNTSNPADVVLMKLVTKIIMQYVKDMNLLPSPETTPDGTGGKRFIAGGSQAQASPDDAAPNAGEPGTTRPKKSVKAMPGPLKESAATDAGPETEPEKKGAAKPDRPATRAAQTEKKPAAQATDAGTKVAEGQTPATPHQPLPFDKDHPTAEAIQELFRLSACSREEFAWKVGVGLQTADRWLDSKGDICLVKDSLKKLTRYQTKLMKKLAAR